MRTRLENKVFDKKDCAGIEPRIPKNLLRHRSRRGFINPEMPTLMPRGFAQELRRSIRCTVPLQSQPNWCRSIRRLPVRNAPCSTAGGGSSGKSMRVPASRRRPRKSLRRVGSQGLDLRAYRSKIPARQKDPCVALLDRDCAAPPACRIPDRRAPRTGCAYAPSEEPATYAA
jgi:hypothetical protein